MSKQTIEIWCRPSPRSWEYGAPTRVRGRGRGALVAVHINAEIRLAIAVGQPHGIEIREFEWRPAVAQRAGRRRELAAPIEIHGGSFALFVQAGRPPIVDGDPKSPTRGQVIAADRELIAVTVEFDVDVDTWAVPFIPQRDLVRR